MNWGRSDDRKLYFSAFVFVFRLWTITDGLSKEAWISCSKKVLETQPKWKSQRQPSKKEKVQEKTTWREKENSAFTLILSGESLHRQLMNVSTKLQSGYEERAIWWKFTLFWIFVKCFYLRFTFLSITGPTCCVEVFSLTGVRSPCVATMFDLTVSHLT